MSTTNDQATAPLAGASPMDQDAIREGARQFAKLYSPGELRLMIAQAALAMAQQGEPFRVWAVEADDREDSDGTGLIGLALSPEGARALGKDHAGSFCDDQAEPAWTDCTDGFSATLFDEMLSLTVSQVEVAQ